MTTTAPEPIVGPPATPAGGPEAEIEVVRRAGEVVVAVLGEPTRRTASMLSCRLHEAVELAADGCVLRVDLGAASVTDPTVGRVLVCARESAVARGLEFRVR